MYLELGVLDKDLRAGLSQLASSQQFLLPALFLGLVIFAILSVAGVLLVRPFHNGGNHEENQSVTITEPPGDLLPAQAGVLIAPGNQFRWDQAFACLLELARRRIVSVEEILSGAARDPIRKYYLRLESRQASVLAFEGGLLQMIFLKGSEFQTRVSLSEVGSRFRARQSRFYIPLAGTLFDKGLLDPARAEAYRNLRRLERLAYMIAIVGAIVAIPGIGLAGFPVLIIPAGFLAGGLVLRRLRQEFSICSEKGQAAVARWKTYAGYLASVAPLPSSSSGIGSFDNQMAYAAAFGLGLTWAQQMMSTQEFDVPAWFQAAETGHLQTGYCNFLAAAAVLDVASDYPDAPIPREYT